MKGGEIKKRCLNKHRFLKTRVYLLFLAFLVFLGSFLNYFFLAFFLTGIFGPPLIIKEKNSILSKLKMRYIGRISGVLGRKNIKYFY